MSPIIRKAATVILVRARPCDAKPCDAEPCDATPGHDRPRKPQSGAAQSVEPEVYLLKRSSASAFMGGYFVFPGGTLDPDDMDPGYWTDRTDLSGEALARCLGGSGLEPAEILGFAIAAIRETLEEAGVLLADTTDRSQVDRLARYRLTDSLEKRWFRDAIKTENIRISLSGLGRWAHWITPEAMKKRFDTRFFTARMPEGQTAEPDGRETRQGIWIRPAAALEKNLTGEIPLSPPTLVTLSQLLEFPTSAGLDREIRARSWGDPVMPRLILTDTGPLLVEPWDGEYDAEQPGGTTDLAHRVLPPGAPFSRLWCDQGIWKPVSG